MYRHVYPSVFNCMKRNFLRPFYENSICLNRLTRQLCSNTSTTNLVSFFVELANGKSIPMKVKPGVTLRDAIAEIKETGEDYGVCGATLACSTCHVVLQENTFDKLRHEISEDEMDILDLAPNIHSSSRLACAIIVGPDLEGALIKVPMERKDARAEEGQAGGD